MKPKGDKSIFAEALTRLLDDTELFQRGDWADVLGVTESAISQWVNDKTLPQPDYLYVIYETLKGSDLPSEEPLDNFRKIAELPAEVVSPHGRRMLPTIWAYMTRSMFDDISKKLAKLSPTEQEKLLESLYSKVATSQISQTVPMPDVVPEERGPYSKSAKAEIGRFARRLRQIDASSRVPKFVCLHSHIHATCTEEAVLSVPEEQFLPTVLRRVLGRADDSGSETVDIALDELSRFPRVVIAGQAGTGKTMFLRHLASQLARTYSRQESQYFPLYVHFNCLSTAWPGGGMNEFVHSLSPPDNEAACPVLIVDGLDEAPKRIRQDLIRNLSNYVDENPEIRSVVASRPMSDLAILREWSHFQIQPLSNLALNQWIFRSLSEGPRKSEWQTDIGTYVAHLSERPEVLTALRNPLFLSVSTSLFKRNAITAFYETDILNECLWTLLDEWERRKKVVRLPFPWARPHRLYSVLSDLSYHCLRTRSLSFTTEQAASWIQEISYDIPIETVLSLLSEMTGVLQWSSKANWSFTHRVFQEYLAARYAVESSLNTAEILGERLADASLRNVFRLACTITNDASPLVKFALEEANLTDAEQAVLLADIIAQDIAAERGLIGTACNSVVRWLGNALSEHAVETNYLYGSSDASKPRWQLLVRGLRASVTLESANGKRVRQVLQSLHRARSSPARDTLIESLASSPNEVVREFSNSINIEGRYSDRITRISQAEHLLAEVQEVPGVM